MLIGCRTVGRSSWLRPGDDAGGTAQRRKPDVSARPRMSPAKAARRGTAGYLAGAKARAGATEEALDVLEGDAAAGNGAAEAPF